MSPYSEATFLPLRKLLARDQVWRKVSLLSVPVLVAVELVFLECLSRAKYKIDPDPWKPLLDSQLLITLIATTIIVNVVGSFLLLRYKGVYDLEKNCTQEVAVFLNSIAKQHLPEFVQEFSHRYPAEGKHLQKIRFAFSRDLRLQLEKSN